MVLKTPILAVLLFPVLAWAQGFNMYSLQVEEEVKALANDGARQLFFVTNADTVFRYRMQGEEVIARKSPFDFDTTWTMFDSIYYLNESTTQPTSTLQVFYKGQKKRLLNQENNKVVYRLHQEHDSLGRICYTNEWRPNHQIIKQQFPTGRESTKILSPYSSSWTYRETHGDTNRVYQMQGNDTSNHNISWPGYHELKRYGNFYITKDWQRGDTLIRSMHTVGIADSTVMYAYQGEREYWHFRKSEFESDLKLQLYSNSKGKPQLQSVYNYRPQNDTATYQWEYYGILAGGAHRKLKEFRLRKDSSRYKEITYLWKENGEIDHLEIKNRWGITRNREPNWRKVTLPVGDDMSIPYRTRPATEKPEYRLKIADKNIQKIAYGNKRLAFVLASTLSINIDLATEYYGGFGREFLLLELTETGKMRGLKTYKNSALDVSKVVNALGEEPLTVPAEFKTIIYAVYGDGTKRQKIYKGILVPVEVLIKQQ